MKKYFLSLHFRDLIKQRNKHRPQMGLEPDQVTKPRFNTQSNCNFNLYQKCNLNQDSQEPSDKHQ